MTTTVYKQLGTKQDLALGYGKVIQSRNGQDVELDKIDIGNSFVVNSVAELRTRTGDAIINTAIVTDYYVLGGGGGRTRTWKDGAGQVDNGGNIIVPGGTVGSVSTVGAWTFPQNKGFFADEFGAYNDGTHAAETTAAINAAAAALVGQGTVYLGTGSYLHDGTIILGDGNHLLGMGFSVTNLTTLDNIIQLKITGFWSSVSGISFTKTGVSTVENIYNLGFGVNFSRNFVQVANNQVAGGYVEADVTAYDLAVSSGNSGMVDTTDSGQGVQTIEDNVFSQCYCWLTSSDSQFLNNDVWASEATIGASQLPFAIKVQNMSAWLIQGCDIINGAPSNTTLGYGGGIVIHNAFLGRIYDNYFNPNDKINNQAAPDTMHHISTSHSSGMLDIKIRGNTFRHAYRQGIYTTRMNRSQITNNLFFHGNVADNTYADIDVGGVNNVSGNIISENTHDNSLTLANPGLAINIQTADTWRGAVKDSTIDGSYLSPYVAWDELGGVHAAFSGMIYNGVVADKRSGSVIMLAGQTSLGVAFSFPLVHTPKLQFLSINVDSITGYTFGFGIQQINSTTFTIKQELVSAVDVTYNYKYKLD